MIRMVEDERQRAAALRNNPRRREARAEEVGRAARLDAEEAARRPAAPAAPPASLARNPGQSPRLDPRSFEPRLQGVWAQQQQERKDEDASGGGS